MKTVKEMPFDVNFFNMEDPDVFKRMRDSKKGPALWKKTYGFDFTAFVPGIKSHSDLHKCHLHCLKAEYGTFAKKCKKEGGFFKCCVIGLRHDTYETIRIKFKKMGIIKKGSSDRKCNVDWNKGNCQTCHTTHVCAKQVSSKMSSS